MIFDTPSYFNPDEKYMTLFLRKLTRKFVSVRALRKIFSKGKIVACAPQNPIVNDKKKYAKIVKTVEENGTSVKIEQELNKIKARLKRTVKSKDFSVIIGTLASIAYDNARSGTEHGHHATILCAVEILSEAHKYTLPKTGQSLVEISRAAFLFSLAGYVSNTDLLSLLFQKISSLILKCLSSESVIFKTSTDVYYVLDHLAAAGYSPCYDPAYQQCLSKLKRLLDVNRDDERAIPSDSYDLFSPCGYPLRVLWAHSAKQKKIRPAEVKLSPGTRKFQGWGGDSLLDFADRSKPLILDIGCGFGVSLLGLAAKNFMQRDCNYLGCDLSQHAVNFARGLAARWGLSNVCKYVSAPAETVIQHIVSLYNGPIIAILIQYPTPFKLPLILSQESKVSIGKNKQLPIPGGGFMVSKELIITCLQNISPSGIFYIQSNVEDVAVHMKISVEAVSSTINKELMLFDSSEGKGICRVDISNFFQEPTRDPVTKGSSKQHIMSNRACQWREMGGRVAEGLGWLQQSPFPVCGRTETEAVYQIDNKQVYRVGWIC